MNVGDLVRKTGGYGAECHWVALFLGYHKDTERDYLQVIVLHEGEVDYWGAHCVERIV